MKSKEYSPHYSLEERLIEPFRSIRWIALRPQTLILSLAGLLTFIGVWWFYRNSVFEFWRKELTFFLKFGDSAWSVGTGYWPTRENPIAIIPKLNAAILQPFQTLWWSFAIASGVAWVATRLLPATLLPLKAFARFVLFLIWISLACFGVAPLQFHHTIEEWSKIFFLGAYGSFLIYALIWTCGVLWFPIKTLYKWGITIFAVAYILLGAPLLLFLCVLTMKFGSLLLLPLFALLIAPLTQLGWFISFYAFALSAGSDPRKEVIFE